MDEKGWVALKYIGIVVLGNGLLLVALLLLAAWGLGWRKGLRRVWEFTLVVSVYFGVVLAGMMLLFPALSHWLLLHENYSSQQIHDEGLRVERFIGKTTVVFSNGDERPVGGWHTLFMMLLFFLWWLLDVWVTCRVARRFAPSVWAEFTAKRRHAP